MKKINLFICFLLAFVFAQAQKQHVLRGYLYSGINIMVYDRFSGFTHAGACAGLQLQYIINKKLKVQLDATGGLFSINKILFVLENGETIGPKQSVFTTFAGIVYSPVKKVEMSLSAGPSFIETGIYAGVKPYVGYYLGKREKTKAFASLTHIFEKNSISKKNSGFISFGVAVKLF